jgi:Flp pilus assembly protein TadG
MVGVCGVPTGSHSALMGNTRASGGPRSWGPRDMEPHRFAGLCRRLGRERDGVALILFTICASLIIIVVAVGIDYARAMIVKQRLVNAADAAAIAVARDPDLTPAEVEATANAYITAHYDSSDFGQITARTITATAESVRVQVTARMPTTFLHIMGIKTVDVAALTEVLRRQRKLEVVLVLDNTGSMCSPSCVNKLDKLKAAATSMVDILFADLPEPDAVKIGLVPFSGAVNVGTDKLGSGWIDTGGLSPLQTEDIDIPPGLTLLGLYGQIQNVSWGGCVRARVGPMNYDEADTPPDAANGATLWVPYFAPDEPGRGNGPGDDGLGYYQNDYVDDTEIPGTVIDKQRNGTKYDGATVTPGLLAGASPFGPNFNCVAQPIQALTNSQSIINTAIAGMQAAGSTVIPSGLAWGWRVISATPPYQEGAPYSDQETIKAIILLTDGQNNVSGSNGHNNSYYSSYGYAASGHIGPVDGSGTRAALDAKTSAICSRIKADHDGNANDVDIYLYTITFLDEGRIGSTEANQIRTLMKNCATPDPKCPGQKCYYDSPSAPELETAFRNIAKSLKELRIAK